MRGDLAVRIFDGTTDRHVTRHVSGLRFTKTAPGGHLAASMRLNLPRDAFTDLGPADKCWIYDARNGRTIFEGFTQNPGVTDGPEGQGFDLSVIGSTVLATDENLPLIYVDKDLSPFAKSTGSTPSSNIETGLWIVDSTSPRVRAQLTPGQPVTTGDNAAAEYTSLVRAGMYLGGFYTYLQSGRTDGFYRATAYLNASTIDLGTAGAIYTTGAAETRWIVTDYAAGTNYLSLSVRRSGGATNIATDDVWTDYVDVSIIGQRMDRYGTLLTGSAGLVSVTQVLASQVVEDLLGRVLTFCDPSTSQVDVTTFGITQLAYPEAVNTRRVLEDLAGYEPDFLWEILHSTPNGYVFNYRAWPTEARYEISTADGYNKSGSDVDLCNRIAVSWVDSVGSDHVEIVTTSVPALDDQGRTRDADSVTLPPSQGSEANAIRYGEEILAARNEGPKAATARLGRRIFDRLRGCSVWPWELETGYLVSVRETGDLLRLTQMEYVDADGAATLQLGYPTPTVDERATKAWKAAISGRRPHWP